MKLLLTSDWHLMKRQPSYIENDYLEVQAKKLGWLSGLEYDYILVAGDVFDRPTANSLFINWCLSKLPDNIIAIPGNHDLPVRTVIHEIKKSVFLTMILSEKFDKRTQKLIEGHPVHLGEGVFLFGLPYGYDFSDIPPLVKGKQNILMVHEQVFKDKVPHWSNGVYAKDLVTKYPGFDLILSGDVHESFMIRHKKTGRIVCNPGGLFYSSENDKDKFVFIYDTETRNIESVKVPRYEQFVSEIKFSGELGENSIELFVKYIMEREVDTVDFLGAVRELIRDEGLDKNVRNILKEALDEVA